MNEIIDILGQIQIVLNKNRHHLNNYCDNLQKYLNQVIDIQITRRQKTFEGKLEHLLDASKEHVESVETLEDLYVQKQEIINELKGQTLNEIQKIVQTCQTKNEDVKICIKRSFCKVENFYMDILANTARIKNQLKTPEEKQAHIEVLKSKFYVLRDEHTNLLDTTRNTISDFLREIETYIGNVGEENEKIYHDVLEKFKVSLENNINIDSQF